MFTWFWTQKRDEEAEEEAEDEEEEEEEDLCQPVTRYLSGMECGKMTDENDLQCAAYKISTGLDSRGFCKCK